MRVRELKEDLLFNADFMDLLEVMKNIAILQFKSMQKKKERFIRFAQLLRGFFRMLDIKRSPHKFIHPVTDRSAIVMVTSNEGFTGDLNSQVVASAMRLPGSGSSELIVIGESGERYLRDRGGSLTAFKGADDADGRAVLAREVKDCIIKGAKENRFGRVVIYYPNPVSFMIQEVEAVEVLPLSSFFPQKGEEAFNEPFIIESPLGGVIEYLAEKFIEQKLVEFFEDSKLSEFAARAAHLERSGQELADKQRYLKTQYFRAYHEVIDRNTRELFSSQIIIKRKESEQSQ